MTTRRQPSTTSLSKYARMQPNEFANRSLDFCNAFWGLGDAGVDVLFARMRGATRTMEELRNFWKERAIIEEQYAKRLSSLAKFTLGRDEIGELRNALDVLRLETDKQATFHLQVSQQIKTGMEGHATTILNKQLHHKKTYQSGIEKEFKTKQTQEGYVNKAREKYEADCIRINSYTAQSTLMQGRDLERIQLKLERAQQTVHANERDFASFTRALQETTHKWEVDWKNFCDSCQDLEEERMEFIKDNMWAYANSISTVCVSVDDSCEKIRISLEQCETEKDMENFVRDYGTGNQIPDPPQFVNYANPEAIPSSNQRQTSHMAAFERASQRSKQGGYYPPAPPPEEDPTSLVNTAGVGAGGGRPEEAEPPMSRARSASRASVRSGQPPMDLAPNGMNGSPNPGLMNGAPPPGAVVRAPIPQQQVQVGPKTMLKVGERAYEVDLASDPNNRPTSAASGRMGQPNIGQEDDPLARQLEQLRSGAGSSNSHRKNTQGSLNGHPGVSRDSSTNLSPPPGSRGGGPPNKVDYRRSAEFVVGLPPPGATPSRPTSPGAPTAAFMSPPSHSNADVQNMLNDYQQSLPGERKSISRPGSRASFSGPSPTHPRPMSGGGEPSMAGNAGIGAQGRSPSPQPFRPPSRAPSPNMQASIQQQQQQQQQQPNPAANRRNSYRVPAPGAPAPAVSPVGSHTQSRQGSMSVPQAPLNQQRPSSPNSVGIALNSDGRVTTDEMAGLYGDRMVQQQSPAGQQPYGRTSQQGQAMPPTSAQHMSQQSQHMQHPSTQRTASYPPANQPPYGAPPPASGYPPNYAQQASHQQQQQIQSQSPHGQSPTYMNQQPRPNQTNQQYQPAVQPAYQPQPHPQVDYGHPNANAQRAMSLNAVGGGGVNVGGGGGGSPGYFGPQHQQQQQQPMGYQQHQQPQRAPSPIHGPPSPQPPLTHPQPTSQQQQQAPPPTGQYTEDGRGVLFYVKAMYDYQASIEEEFDFQAGDIIAVTDTPEDGWWSGELLDEARRQPGRHIFPSNFVCLF